MAAYCFCGCGRQVRFGKKRASGHGAEVTRLLAMLEIEAVPMTDAQGSIGQRDELARLISDGKILEGIFRGIAHGVPVAPPPISSISGWFKGAKLVEREVERVASRPRA